MAAACAAAFAADKLFFLTDVDGVRGPGGKIIPELTPAGASRLIAGGVATGGMQAKLAAAVDGLEKGVGEIVIAPGGTPGIVGRLLDQGAVGSRLVRN